MHQAERGGNARNGKGREEREEVCSCEQYLSYLQANWPNNSGIRGVIRETVVANLRGIISAKQATVVLRGIEGDLRHVMNGSRDCPDGCNEAA